MYFETSTIQKKSVGLKKARLVCCKNCKPLPKKLNQISKKKTRIPVWLYIVMTQMLLVARAQMWKFVCWENFDSRHELQRFKDLGLLYICMEYATTV